MAQNMSINDTELKINKIFSIADIKYGISLFKKEEIEYVNNLIIEQEGNLKIKCQIRNKYVPAKPEEIVRQLWIYELLMVYGYPKERIEIEREIQFGANKGGNADITVLQEDNQTPYIIFETKRPERTDGLEQLKTYCNAEGAPIGVWSNGNDIVMLHREEPNIYVDIPRIPKVNEALEDILKVEKRNFEWLEKNNKLNKNKSSLQKIVKELEDIIRGTSGVDPFEETFKLFYTKLYDEWLAMNDKSYILQFYAKGKTTEQVKEAISNLFDGAKKQWGNIFEPTDKIKLQDDNLKECISFLETIKLFNSDLRALDNVFEFLINRTSKKMKGQFFTPRPVEDMCIKMLNPKVKEFVIDPACGSAGFLLHSALWMSDNNTIIGLSEKAKNFLENNAYGIDFDETVVKVAKAINLIAGDGKTHIFIDNSLAPQDWKDETKAGLRAKLSRFPNEIKKDRENQEKFVNFDFDVLLTNPPFAGPTEESIKKLYSLAKKNNEVIRKIGLDVLFLERSLQFIKPGGRMAIILPQGLLNNTKAEYIRRFIIDEARILAVVDLHENTFKPHTVIKTSVLFLKKYTEEEKEKMRQIGAKYEGEWKRYLEKLKEKYKNLAWDSSVNEEEIPEELNSFIETYFETIEEIGGLPAEEAEDEEKEVEEKENKKSLAFLLKENYELDEALNTKKEEIENINSVSKPKLKKEIKILENKKNKLVKEISKRTLAGQISLVISDEKITEAFKNYWIDGKVIQEMDYPIFFAVNEKPVKDESGEYIYKKKPDGSLVEDKKGNPLIDHDLDEIAEEFKKIAKEQLKKGDDDFDFWR